MATLYEISTGTLLESVHTTDYVAVSKPFPKRSGDYLINPDLASVLATPMRYWKVDSNDDLVVMTAPEQQAVDDAVAAASLAAAKQEAKDVADLLVHKSVAKVVVAWFADVTTVINNLRAQHSLSPIPPRDFQDFQDAVIAEIDAAMEE